MGGKPIVVDMFCGGGGESTGIASAYREAGLEIELHAINHWEVAVETHSRNHPWARHYCEEVQNVDPVQAVGGGRRVALLWASPECTHHSVARGGRPRSDQSRASAWLVLKWLQELYVERVIVENVPEFLNWGPLGANGEPLASGRGRLFAAWKGAIEALGYRVDWRILNAADHGAPTTRRRLFVQAVRGRKRIFWPQPTHAEKPGLFGELPWVPAAAAIDWRMPSPSIAGRRKPLAAATMARIEAGIRRYWGAWAEPFLVVLRGTGGARELSAPLPTVTAGGQHLGLVEPLFMPQQSGGIVKPTTCPLSTVATAGAISVVEPFLAILRGQSETREAGRPMPTVSCSGAHFGLVEPFLVQYYGKGGARSAGEPLDTVTCRDRFGLVQGDQVSLDIGFRMLQPAELAAAQSFPPGYDFAGTKSDQVKQIGNAVPCLVAQALTATGINERQ